MRFTVIWVPRAEASLASLWLNATDKQAVADASNRLDEALAEDPELKGTPLGKFFVMEEAPLAVLYHVAMDDRMVRVISVKRV